VRGRLFTGPARHRAGPVNKASYRRRSRFVPSARPFDAAVRGGPL